MGQNFRLVNVQGGNPFPSFRKGKLWMERSFFNYVGNIPVVLVYKALLDLGYDTDYVQCILEEMQISDMERRAFLYYTLVFCVDFMGENC